MVVLELLESLLLLGQGRGLGRVVLAFRQALLALQHFTAAAVAAEFITILDRLILGLCRVSVVLVVVAMAQGTLRLLVLMARQIQAVGVAVVLLMTLMEFLLEQMVVLVGLV